MGKYTGIPLLCLLLLLILWITVVGANVPSGLLQTGFAKLRTVLDSWLSGTPEWVQGLLLDGMYQVLTWVIAVMLPPMAIFFPLFTLLLTTGRLSVRPLFSLCWNMRETIPDDVYGARLQCSRGDRLPDY